MHKMEDSAMNFKLLNSTLDVVAQKGVLILLEAAGFYYLFIATHSDPFILEKALIGLVLVLTGATFEYLVTMAKVSYLKGVSAKRADDIEKEKNQLEHYHDKILKELDSLKNPQNINIKG